MNEDRAPYDRSKLRYPSDLTDAEWGSIRPLIPPAKRRRWQAHSEHPRGDQRPHVSPIDRQSVACDSKDFPPKGTVWGYFDLWSYGGT
jgi:putative transposase